MSDPVPSKWVAIVVEYGEKQKHLYWSTKNPSPSFFATEPEAQKYAEDHCRYDQKATVLILRAERLVRAKPVDFEIVAA